MLKDIIEAAALAAFDRIAAPYLEEIRNLKAENEAMKARVTALEGRPDPFDVRKYIEERLDELDLKREAPSAEEVAEAISDRALAKALESIDFSDNMTSAAQDWMADQDWSGEIEEALNSGSLLDEDSIQGHVWKWLESDAGKEIIGNTIRLNFQGRTIEVALK